MVFTPAVKAIKEELEPAYWFIFYHDELLISDADVKCSNHIPFISDIKNFRSNMSDIQYLGLVDGKDSYIASSSEKFSLEGHVFMGLRRLFGDIEDDWYWLANRAFHLNYWKKKNRYCGSCGEAMHISEDEVAMKCKRCGNIVYPRISPAVIVAITKGEQILLAHAARFTGGMYSVIAGFVEPGETLEECVRREIMEEVGLCVRNIRYFASQPWPYPDSLMIAFTAEYESGDIRIDDKEITDANWYSRDDLPELPLNVSVARKLINAWLSK
jgi:NAD+ diphosphatase